MNDPSTTAASEPAGRALGAYRRGVFATLARIRAGTLTVGENGRTRVFGTAAEGEPDAEIVIRDPHFFRDVVLAGDLGAAESFMHGDFDCPDLTALVRLFIRNREALEGLDGGLAGLRRMLRDAIRFMARNSRRGSRRNIAAHYDLGNDLFRLFLDDNMMYSSAIFEHEDSTLEEASRLKNDLICRKLELGPDDHLLEIGTGWGGFAIQAARDYGCRVTTTTISRRQHELAVERVREAGLQDRVTLLTRDYRDLDGEYDKLVSIEMLEAVGYEYYDTYFAQCSRLLKPNGLMCLQTITINEQAYQRARGHVDFIKKYIFPGGCLPSLGAIADSLRRATDMNVAHVAEIGAHYARTLQHWRTRFNGAVDRVLRCGYDERFVRMWQYYLHYCEAGFLERVIGDVQMVLFKPQNRRADITGIDHTAGAAGRSVGA